MTGFERHLDERLDDWLDDRLEAAGRREVEEHLAACARCRRLGDALVATREALRQSAAQPAPADLPERLAGWLDREDAASRAVAPAPPPAVAPRRAKRWPGLALAAALALLAVGAAAWLLRGAAPRPDPVAEAFREYERLARAPLPPELAAARPESVEGRWRAAGVAFPARVLDLSGMGIALAGGDARRLGGTLAARSLYRGEAGWIHCWMFEERAAAPWRASAERRQAGSFEFEIHRRAGATLVLWREGAVVCALVGGGDPESVIALAQAKAMLPPPAAATT